MLYGGGPGGSGTPAGSALDARRAAHAEGDDVLRLAVAALGIETVSGGVPGGLRWLFNLRCQLLPSEPSALHHPVAATPGIAGRPLLSCGLLPAGGAVCREAAGSAGGGAQWAGLPMLSCPAGHGWAYTKALFGQRSSILMEWVGSLLASPAGRLGTMSSGRFTRPVAGDRA